ncbi:hypothetical protein Tco_0313820 [Tanacetum coccineum]
MIQPGIRRDYPGYPLVSVEVLGVDPHSPKAFKNDGGGPWFQLSHMTIPHALPDRKTLSHHEAQVTSFQEWYEHVGPEVASPQDGKVTRWRRDYAWLMISRCSRSLCQYNVQRNKLNPEVNGSYNIFTRGKSRIELKTKDKA